MSRVLIQSRWIFLKELASFWGSNLPALSIGILLFCSGILAFLLSQVAGMTYEGIATSRFRLFYFFVLLAALFLSMASFVSEKRQGTLELLYTLPVTDLELVIGKFLMGVVLVAFRWLSA